MQGVDKQFADTFGNYILHGIEEVHLPETVSWWPQTIGWKVLGLLLLIAVAYWLSVQAKKWWRNRYRRDALSRLASLEQRANGWQQVVRQLPFLLKATALQAYPRCDVAQLSGSLWLQFLDAQYEGPAFHEGSGQILLLVAYQPESQWHIKKHDAQSLIEMSRLWIREHRPAAVEISRA